MRQSPDHAALRAFEDAAGYVEPMKPETLLDWERELYATVGSKILRLEARLVEAEKIIEAAHQLRLALNAKLDPPDGYGTTNADQACVDLVYLVDKYRETAGRVTP